MISSSPITPPPELRRQWLDNDHFPMVTGTNDLLSITRDRLRNVMDQAAQWGADQELDKSNNWLVLNGYGEAASRLRAARRPKPPSLKEQALSLLAKTDGPIMLGNPEYRLRESEVEIIRRALEALDD
jgi:hypothetical protein